MSTQLTRPRHGALSTLGCSSREDGYVLLTLLLAVSLFAIAFTYSIYYDRNFARAQRQRDQEEELIHRGVQYSRAIRSYYKKFGRYPTRLEDLDNTNNLRYLRKHYKDPVTGKDFKLLHYGDPGVSLGGSFGGGVIPGANTVGQLNGSSSSSFGANSSGSGSFGSNSSGSSNSAFGGSGFGNSGSSFGSSGVNSSGAFSQSSSFGGNASSGFGTNSNSQTSATQQGTNTAAGTDPSQSVTQAPGTTQQPGDATSGGQTVFGGGPIVGVASASKDTTIREFNHKRKYNEWQFVYDPTTDRGTLLLTPNQPLLQLAGGQPGQIGQPAGTTNTNGSSSFGQSSSGQSSFGQSSFGQGTGYGNSGSTGGSTTPAQPPSNSQSPQ
jgi:type II secretory pathway pseudopilin PulG